MTDVGMTESMAVVIIVSVSVDSKVGVTLNDGLEDTLTDSEGESTGVVIRDRLGDVAVDRKEVGVCNTVKRDGDENRETDNDVAVSDAGVDCSWLVEITMVLVGVGLKLKNEDVGVITVDVSDVADKDKLDDVPEVTV
jgi:hypothetical protein